MANPIASAWQSFWHTMTSNDRHASHDSPYRTGRHIPLPQSRHAPLTSVATSGAESRVDLSQSYSHDEAPTSNGFIGSPKGPMSPASPRPYSPGLRSLSRQATAESDNFDNRGGTANGEMEMRDFADGVPPPPPVSHSWKRIDRFLEDNYGELFDNLCEGATSNDVNELEHELDATLPMDVRESLQIHDGQERGGLPTGVIFGLMLLDCEEIIMEWQNWRKVAEEYLSAKPDYRSPQIPVKAFAGASTAPPVAEVQQRPGNGLWRQELLARQDSQPPNAVQKAYAHPAWIPLARDWGGNYLAVDLAPGPAGHWGQIIIYGRDYDCKYVVARSWAHLLAMVADDFGNAEKVHIDEETGELKFLEFKKRQNVEPPYLEILRWRCDQKYGRRVVKRRPMSGAPGGGLRVNANVGGSGLGSAGSSPYGSPVVGPEERRGRSPHRLAPASGSSAKPGSSKSKGISPRGPVAVSSPLARVAEEAPTPIRVHTSSSVVEALDSKAGAAMETLISVDTPRPSGEIGRKEADGRGSVDKENKRVSEDGKGKKEKGDEEGELKTVEI
ncbi:cell wall assembly and cell proliferation coordinating protein [Westerdykella ornata]|uniref:Cell wall assembly and cell proliferation coordinating protein n=1 Tax=Westerdykella ornata TaxID=318751 RepID=A0A6A6J8M7_WESOR|nr:cell wall assembly and cell proliferation coordinating protein [Westerdykella ornata]KAF2272782.1 cell wall assembly and cell proliferation coordinating protein [Westerdykella ornata]